MNHHRVQHLRSSNNDLSGLIDFLNDSLLNNRHMFKRNFHSHVASGDHNAICFLYNRINIVYPLLVFYFGNNMDILTAVIIEKLSHLPDIPGRSCK